MPAIHPPRLKIPADELVQNASDPEVFCRAYHQFLDSYADRTFRPGKVGEPPPLLRTYQVPKPVSRAVDKQLGVWAGENRADALNLADVLWLQPILEFRLTAASVIGKIDPLPVIHIFSRVERQIILEPFGKVCLPHLKNAENPHILVLSPPPMLEPKWLASHLAYTLSKYGMSMCVLGMAEEFKPRGIEVNALWPRTVIATAAVQNLLGRESTIQRSRKPDIMADAAYIVLTPDSRKTTGNFFVDEEVLASDGITDLDHYALNPDGELIQDLFL